MKKLILLFSTLLLLGSCDNYPSTDKRTSMDGYDVVVIDSCEYIEVSHSLGFDAGYYSLTHKGNCKYCSQKKCK